MGSPFKRKMMMKSIIFNLATAAVVLGAPKEPPSDPRKFAKAPDFVAPATYRQGPEYYKKYLERLDKRSAIEGIPELLTKKEFVEGKDQGIMEKYKAPAAPASYRLGPVYTKRNLQRLDKRSAIKGIPDLLTKKENKEEARHLEIQEGDKFWQEAPLLTLTQEQELSDEDK